MKRKLFVACVALLIVLFLSTKPSGASYADSYLKWDNPGPWQHNDPGYEHDLVAHKNYFRDCTSWTNLPDGYNDCPTAGVFEPSDMWYLGNWVFLIGWDPSTDFYLNGQETYHGFCPWDSIWCMKASRTTSPPLLQGQFHLGQSYYGSW